MCLTPLLLCMLIYCRRAGWMRIFARTVPQVVQRQQQNQTQQAQQQAQGLGQELVRTTDCKQGGIWMSVTPLAKVLARS